MYRIRYKQIFIHLDICKVKYPKALHAFGIRLRQLREERNLSQQELADLSDLTRITITRFENGQMNPTFDALVGITKGLEIPLKELVDVELPKEKPVRKI